MLILFCTAVQMKLFSGIFKLYISLNPIAKYRNHVNISLLHISMPDGRPDLRIATVSGLVSLSGLQICVEWLQEGTITMIFYTKSSWLEILEWENLRFCLVLREMSSISNRSPPSALSLRPEASRWKERQSRHRFVDAPSFSNCLTVSKEMPRLLSWFT